MGFVNGREHQRRYEKICSLIEDAWKADPIQNAWAGHYIEKDGKGRRRTIDLPMKSIVNHLILIENEEERLTTARIIAEKEKRLTSEQCRALIARVIHRLDFNPDLVQSIEVDW